MALFCKYTNDDIQKACSNSKEVNSGFSGSQEHSPLEIPLPWNSTSRCREQDTPGFVWSINISRKHTWENLQKHSMRRCCLVFLGMDDSVAGMGWPSACRLPGEVWAASASSQGLPCDFPLSGTCFLFSSYCFMTHLMASFQCLILLVQLRECTLFLPKRESNPP